MNIFKRFETLLDDLDQQGARIIGSPQKGEETQEPTPEPSMVRDESSTAILPSRVGRGGGSVRTSRPAPKPKSDDEIFAFLNESQSPQSEARQSRPHPARSSSLRAPVNASADLALADTSRAASAARLFDFPLAPRSLSRALEAAGGTKKEDIPLGIAETVEASVENKSADLFDDVEALPPHAVVEPASESGQAEAVTPVSSLAGAVDLAPSPGADMTEPSDEDGTGDSLLLLLDFPPPVVGVSTAEPRPVMTEDVNVKMRVDEADGVDGGSWDEELSADTLTGSLDTSSPQGGSAQEANEGVSSTSDFLRGLMDVSVEGSLVHSQHKEATVVAEDSAEYGGVEERQGAMSLGEREAYANFSSLTTAGGAVDESNAYVELLKTATRSSKENGLLKKEVRSLHDEVTAMEGQMARLQEILEDGEEHISRLENEIESKNFEFVKFTRTHEALKQSLARKEEEVAALREELVTERAASAKLASSQEHSIGTLNDSISLLNGKLETMQAENEELHQSKARASSDTVQHLDDLRAEIERERVALESAKKSLQDRVATLEADIAEYTKALSASQRLLEQKEGEVNAALKQVNEVRAAKLEQEREQRDYQGRAKQVLQAKEDTILRLTQDLEDATARGGTEGEDKAASEAENEVQRLREELELVQAEVEDLQAALEESEERLQHEAEVLRQQAEVLKAHTQQERLEKTTAQLDLLRAQQDNARLRSEKDEAGQLLAAALKEREKELLQAHRNLKLLRAEKGGKDGADGDSEDAVRSLTDMLVEKQALVETLNNEKRALELRAESETKRWRAEMEYRQQSTPPPALGLSQRSRVRGEFTLGMSVAEPDTPVKMRPISSLVPRSWGAPDTPETTRHKAFNQVVGGANALDSASARFVVLLRQYPIARLLVILYVLVLHIWVFFLLSRPLEIHDESFAFPGTEAPNQ